MSLKLKDIVAEQQRLERERKAKLEGKGSAKVSPVVAAPGVEPEAQETEPAGDQTVSRAMGTHPQLIYVDQIDLDPGQPRKLKAKLDSEAIAAFEPDGEDKGPDPDGLRALARSVNTHGLLSPLVVDRQRGRFKLIAGERRYWAVRLLHMKQVPAVIWGKMPPIHRLALQVTENLQRRDLPREAKKEVLLRLVDEMDGNVSEVCRLLSISRTAFYRTVGEGEAKKERRISSGQLVRILANVKDRLPNMTREDQVKVLAAVTELEGWIQSHLAPEQM